ncbi:MAG: response regulator [Patescibacteria group bacterium]|nr:response regulator [Patescibacteria group bacterium]
MEDDALLARVLLESITSANFNSLNIKDGLEVLEAVKKFKPHIILLDLVLPGLDGFEVLKRLKADNEAEKIPVFVLSNLQDVSDVKSVKALGAEQYFIKARSQMEEIIKAVEKRLK